MSSDPPLPDSLTPIVERAYAIFAPFRATLPLQVCQCHSCMPLERQQMLHDHDVQDLPHAFLDEWNSSVLFDDHATDPDHLDEVRHFLPRLMDLAGRGLECGILGMASTFAAPAQLGWRSWPADQVEVIDDYLDAVLVDVLASTAVSHPPVGHVPARDAGDVMAMVAMADGHGRRLIEAARTASDPGCAIHLAWMRQCMERPVGKRPRSSMTIVLPKEITNDFAFDVWLSGSEVLERLERAFFAIEGDDHDSRAWREIISRAVEYA